MALPSFIEMHKKQEEEEAPWLLSYSDMFTLLLCFFVVLVSISDLDFVKIEMFTQHFAKTERITLKKLVELIQEFINSENLQDDVAVKLTSKGVEISFKDKLLFDLGKADLKPKATEVLAKISPLLNYREISQRKIYVEGHTDSLPIKSEKYPSNWELSSARAANVVKFFTARKLDHRRFEAVGLADTLPIKPEIDRNLGQPENRRVVVVVSAESYMSKPKRKEKYVSEFAKEISDRNRVDSHYKIAQVYPVQNTIITNRQTADIKIEQNKLKKHQMEKYFVLGQQHFKNGKYKDAIDAWEEVLKLDPEHQLSKVNIIRAKAKLKKIN